MKIDVETLPVKNNRDKERFEVQLGDGFGVILYRKRSAYILAHTEVPEAYTGRGIATHLVHEALEQIKAENGRIVPVCPFVKAYLQRHPEYQSLVAAHSAAESDSGPS